MCTPKSKPRTQPLVELSEYMHSFPVRFSMEIEFHLSAAAKQRGTGGQGSQTGWGYRYFFLFLFYDLEAAECVCYRVDFFFILIGQPGGEGPSLKAITLQMNV